MNITEKQIRALKPCEEGLKWYLKHKERAGAAKEAAREKQNKRLTAMVVNRTIKDTNQEVEEQDDQRP